MEGAHSPLFLNLHHGRPARALPRKLTTFEQAEIRFAFDRLVAANGAAAVTPHQLKIALRALGFPVKKAQVSQLLRENGLSDTTPLDFDTFQELIAAKIGERTPAEELHRAFQLFDIEGRGGITPQNLAAIARQLNIAVEPEELEDMVAEFDANGDGIISEAEFRDIMAAEQQ
jgi:centrin-3